jgi:hypothetical protein
MIKPWDRGNLVGHKIKKRPGLLRVAGRPNSPPPELLTQHTTQRLRAWEVHFRAMTWHEVAKAPNPLHMAGSGRNVL